MNQADDPLGCELLITLPNLCVLGVLSGFHFFMAIRQITIIGTGLIGGSLGLALRKKKFAGRIVGCDREGTLERARMRGAIDDRDA